MASERELTAILERLDRVCGVLEQQSQNGQAPLRERYALSVDEVAAMLGVCRSSVYSAIGKGRLPQPRKLVGRSLILTDDLRDALRELPEVK